MIEGVTVVDSLHKLQFLVLGGLMPFLGAKEFAGALYLTRSCVDVCTVLLPYAYMHAD